LPLRWMIRRIVFARPTRGQSGSLDMNGFEQRFAARAEALRTFVVRLHGEMDARLTDLHPRTIAGVRRVAESLIAVAKKVP
jgi:hypothetical protein